MMNIQFYVRCTNQKEELKFFIEHDFCWRNGSIIHDDSEVAPDILYWKVCLLNNSRRLLTNRTGILDNEYYVLSFDEFKQMFNIIKNYDLNQSKLYEIYEFEHLYNQLTSSFKTFVKTTTF